MSRIILTQNGVDNTNIDGARIQNFAAGNRSGIVRGSFNEARIISTISNTITLTSGVLILSGHTIVINQDENFVIGNIPSTPTRYAMIAEIVVQDGSVTFDLRIQPPQNLQKDNLFLTGNGTFQLEIGRFTVSSAGVTDIAMTAERITGGTTGHSWIVGTVTTNNIDAGLPAAVRIHTSEDEETGKEIVDFEFDIPRAESTTIIRLQDGTMIVDSKIDEDTIYLDQGILKSKQAQVVQEIGDSETKVMSQNAVTQILDEIQENLEEKAPISNPNFIGDINTSGQVKEQNVRVYSPNNPQPIPNLLIGSDVSYPVSSIHPVLSNVTCTQKVVQFGGTVFLRQITINFTLNGSLPFNSTMFTLDSDITSLNIAFAAHKINPQAGNDQIFLKVGNDRVVRNNNGMNLTATQYSSKYITI